MFVLFFLSPFLIFFFRFLGYLVPNSAYSFDFAHFPSILLNDGLRNRFYAHFSPCSSLALFLILFYLTAASGACIVRIFDGKIVENMD
jgi:hypothetical protein